MPTIDFQKDIINGTSIFAWYSVRYKFLHYHESVYLQMMKMGLQRQIGSELNIIEFIERHTSVDFANLKTNVLTNLKNGKVKGDDLDSHLKFIQDHHITEALQFLDKYIEDKIEASNRQRNIALEVYIALGGRFEYLYQVLKGIAFIEGDSRESTIINHFYRKNDNIFEQILQDKLGTSTENERNLRYAVCLFNSGNLAGLKFLVNYTEIERKSPFPFYPLSDIQFENPKGISLIFKLFDFGYDTSIPQDAFNRISNIARSMLLHLSTCQQCKYYRTVQLAIQRRLNLHTLLNKLPTYFKKWLYVAPPEALKDLQYLLKDLEFQHYQKQEVTVSEAVKIWKNLSSSAKT